jgi:hypothetical protein
MYIDGVIELDGIIIKINLMVKPSATSMVSCAPSATRNRGLRKEKGKRKKERERKYSCLVNEEGIVNVKYERKMFILLSFWLKWRV